MPDLATDDDWDVVDEASLESFPASDPPGYHSVHAAPTRRTVAESAVESQRQLAEEKGHKLRNRLIAAGACAGLALAAFAVWRFALRT